MEKRFALVLCAILTITALPQATASEESNLVEHMAGFQYFAQKTYFSIQHKNKPLAEFYLHEMEEILEKVEEVKEFDGFKIGDMSKTLLEPTLKEVDEKVDAGKWEEASKSFDGMIEACNSCHESVNKKYIHITKPKVNPFMQSFEVRE